MIYKNNKDFFYVSAKVIMTVQGNKAIITCRVIFIFVTCRLSECLQITK